MLRIVKMFKNILTISIEYSAVSNVEHLRFFDGNDGACSVVL